MERFKVKTIEIKGINNKYVFKLKDSVEVPQDFASQESLFRYINLKLLGYELEVIPLNDAEDKEGQTDD